jgi:hypothetical protein
LAGEREANEMASESILKLSPGARRMITSAIVGTGLLTGGCNVLIQAPIGPEKPALTPLAPTPTLPTLDPTEAPITLTPTVVNPATQELTLVSPTEMATEMPTLTLTPEPTATLKPESTATVKATATSEFSIEEEANMEAIAARMADYLNSTGDFTYEKMRENMYKRDWITDKNFLQNGIYRCSFDLTSIYITGFNLGLVNLENRQIIIFGTQDTEARRIVVPVQFMPEGYNNDQVTTGIFIGTSDSIEGTQSLIKSKAQFEKIMSEGIGKAFAVEMSTVGLFEMAKIRGFEIIASRLDYAKKIDLYLPANLNMIHSVWRSTSYGTEEKGSYFYINQYIDSTGGSQTPRLIIDSLADLKNLEGVFDKLPLTHSLAIASK